MTAQEQKQEIEKLITELKKIIANYEEQDKNHTLTMDGRMHKITCIEAVKRAGGYIDGFELDPDLYQYTLKKLRNAKDQ